MNSCKYFPTLLLVGVICIGALFISTPAGQSKVVSNITDFATKTYYNLKG